MAFAAPGSSAELVAREKHDLDFYKDCTRFPVVVIENDGSGEVKVRHPGLCADTHDDEDDETKKLVEVVSIGDLRPDPVAWVDKFRRRNAEYVYEEGDKVRGETPSTPLASERC